MRADELVGVYIDAVYPVLLVVTHEEDRVEQALIDIIRDGDRTEDTTTVVMGWSSTKALRCLSSGDDDEGAPIVNKGLSGKSVSPIDVLKRIIKLASEHTEDSNGYVWILVDFVHWLTTGPKYQIQRLMRDAAQAIATHGARHTVIMLDSQMEIPPRMEKVITVVDWPLPTREEIAEIFDLMAEGKRENIVKNTGREGYQRLRYEVSNAALGLSQVEVDNVLARSDSELGHFDPALIVREKKGIIRKRGHLEYWEPEGNLSAVGGCNALKNWLNLHYAAFSPEAKKYGLATPKGLLIVGVSGCGKSFLAKCIGKQWNMPVLRLDIGKVMGSYIGQSERQLREALALADTMAPCVLWMDEIDKGLGASRERDGGTSSRVFGTWLTWMQEKKTPVFVVATANSVEKLPPETLRKGRFDEIFFVDLPTVSEREEIFTVHINKVGRPVEMFDIRRLAVESEGFTGSEIEVLIQTAMCHAYFDDAREFTVEDVLFAAKTATKVSMTMAEQIKELREWAKNRAISATEPEGVKKATATPRKSRRLGRRAKKDIN